MRYQVIHKKPVYILDPGEVNTILELQEEPLTEIFINPEECIDFRTDPVSRQLIHSVKAVTIQGIRHELKPGRQLVPVSVKNFLDELADQKRNNQDKLRPGKFKPNAIQQNYHNNSQGYWFDMIGDLASDNRQQQIRNKKAAEK